MKYPEHKLSMETALPSSVQSWLGNELEIRGIDSVIYSRYIIHLLLEDHDEDSLDYLELFFNPRHDVKSKWKSPKRLHSQEEKKKQAAIECLQAVSEQNCGIEKLVEELCDKLKELNQSSGSDDTDQGDSSPSLSDGSCSELEDPAERYYAAFPALTGQHERSPLSDIQKQNTDIWRDNKSEVWKDNPLTKTTSGKKEPRIQKYKKTAKIRDEKKKVKKKYSPNQVRKKQTPEKPIPKPKSKPNEYFHARFMSWPQSEFVPIGLADKQTSEEKKLCQQVENILKEMLMTGNERKAKEKLEYDSDGTVSPELQENAFWYTNLFAELINPVESGQRLYERHSCPFFHNDDVFLDPVTSNDEQNQPVLEDDQFGLHDLMKNQELQNVAESVLQNVDEDFSKKDHDLEEENISQAFELYPEPGSLIPFENQVPELILSPYDNTAVEATCHLANEEHQAVDMFALLSQNIAREDGFLSNTAEVDQNMIHLENRNKNDNWSLSPFEQRMLNQADQPDDMLPSFTCIGRKEDLEAHLCDTGGSYSQLWDINIWNRAQNCLQKDNRSFLDGFNSTFDDFKSGLDPLPDSCFTHSNRNSGILSANVLNEDLEPNAMLDGENINTLIPMITFDAVDFDVTRQTQADATNDFNRDYDRSISLTDVHLLRSMRDVQLASSDKLSKSYELIPSFNSAFKDVVPRRITHVKSDSNISYFNYSTLIDFEDNTPKPKAEEEKSENENLFLSPKTHFRPISAVVEEDIPDLHLQDLFGGYSPSSTQYQKYQEVTDSRDEESFVPMFKICKQHDKYIQTGTNTEDQPVNEEKLSFEDQGRPPEIVEENDCDSEIIQDFDVYGYIDSLTASAQNTPQNVLDVASNTCCDSGYEEANDDEKLVEEKEKSNWLTVNENNRKLRKEWPQHNTEEPAQSNGKEYWIVKEPENVTEISCSIPDNIWSCNDDVAFPDMFSFFTDECDDLKPQESHENNTQMEHYMPDNVDTGPVDTENPSQATAEDVTKIKLVIGKGKKVLQDIENCSRDNTVSEPIYVKGYMPMPRIAVYSCELEKEWMDTESPQSYNKSSVKSLKGSGRKPCTFFMEGSCKRSDCKFSHDLSTITCRFWEEGDCFKGDLCPFLHGYYVSDIPVDIKENVDDQFEFQEEEFPQLSNPNKKQKQRLPKTDKSNIYVESRRIYRTSSAKQKSTGRLVEKTEN